MAKLDKKDVKRIKELKDMGASYREIANMFNVTPMAIHSRLKGLSTNKKK